MADFNKDLAEQKRFESQKKNAPKVAEIANDENKEPKISITEIFFITPFYLMSDAIDLTLFLFGLDDFGIMDTIRTSTSQIYFVLLKKMGPEIWVKNLIINGIKLFPYIGSLIPSTLAWVVIVFIDRGALNKFKKITESKLGGELLKTVAEKVGKTAGKI